MDRSLSALTLYQVFLVDASRSMLSHRSTLRDVLETLTFITAMYDSNGLDLYFSNRPKSFKCKSSADAVNAFNRVTSYGHDDMLSCVEGIITNYKAQLQEKHRLRRLFDRSQSSRGPRKLSTYVLTDGSFSEKNDLECVLKDLVTHLRASYSSPDQVGIQFIRFDDNTVGKAYLQRLDDNLRAETGW